MKNRILFNKDPSKDVLLLEITEEFLLTLPQILIINAG